MIVQGKLFIASLNFFLTKDAETDQTYYLSLFVPSLFASQQMWDGTGSGLHLGDGGYEIYDGASDWWMDDGCCVDG